MGPAVVGGHLHLGAVLVHAGEVDDDAAAHNGVQEVALRLEGVVVLPGAVTMAAGLT